MIDTSRRESNKLNRIQLEKQRKNQEQQQSGKAPQPQSLSDLVGSNACRECHEVQHTFWQSTNHAKAYSTLAAKQQQFNPNCLPCHVTLPSVQKTAPLSPSTLVALPQPLYNVGCESCHGPGLKHSLDPESQDMVKPSAATCLDCHTEEHDDNFSFDAKIKLVACPLRAHEDDGTDK
jgi:nitrate/TMAO reductase-like tetraheme cytochrome c subunit